MRNDSSVWSDLALGVAAGLTATWAMNQATTYLYEHEDPEARARENEARGDRTSYEAAADEIAAAAGVDLTPERRRALGSGLHWALGGAAGGAYALMRRYWPAAGKGQGLLFGTAFFGLVDEGANTALGFTPGPGAFPWQAHARGLAGHLVYGLVADSFLDAVDMTRRMLGRGRRDGQGTTADGRKADRTALKQPTHFRRALSAIRGGR